MTEKPLDEIIVTKNNQDNSPSIVNMLSEVTLISDKEVQLFAESKQFIIDTYKSVPMYRPLVLKLFGVLNNSEFPTVDSKYWQCKVEAEVHANELIRDMHDAELQKVQLERANENLSKMSEIFKTESDPRKKKEIEFDIREQNIMISKKRFEFLQLQKKIKYRIEEVVQWRQISQRLEKQQTFKNQNYAEMLSEALANKWNNQIKTDKELSDEQRNGLAEQVKMMQELSKQVSIKNQ